MGRDTGGESRREQAHPTNDRSQLVFKYLPTDHVYYLVSKYYAVPSGPSTKHLVQPCNRATAQTAPGEGRREESTLGKETGKGKTENRVAGVPCDLQEAGPYFLQDWLRAAQHDSACRLDTVQQLHSVPSQQAKGKGKSRAGWLSLKSVELVVVFGGSCSMLVSGRLSYQPPTFFFLV